MEAVFTFHPSKFSHTHGQGQLPAQFLVGLCCWKKWPPCITAVERFWELLCKGTSCNHTWGVMWNEQQQNNSRWYHIEKFEEILHYTFKPLVRIFSRFFSQKNELSRNTYFSIFKEQWWLLTWFFFDKPSILVWFILYLNSKFIAFLSIR